jgi:hypothetical protein
MAVSPVSSRTLVRPSVILLAQRVPAVTRSPERAPASSTRGGFTDALGMSVARPPINPHGVTRLSDAALLRHLGRPWAIGSKPRTRCLLAERVRRGSPPGADQVFACGVITYRPAPSGPWPARKR